MAFRFWRRIGIAPGISLNLSKSGVSCSLGPRGAKYTFGMKGQRATVGLPGTGLYYTKKIAGKKAKNSHSGEQTYSRDTSSLDLNFFQNLFTPKEEKDFITGCKELIKDNDRTAFKYFKNSLDLADSALLAGVLGLKLELFNDAVTCFNKALEHAKDLNTLFNKYKISPMAKVKITEQISVYIQADKKSAILGLIEAYQAIDDIYNASKHLQDLHNMYPEDPTITLSLVELIYLDYPRNTENMKNILDFVGNPENDSEIHAALMYYQALAYIELKMFVIAKDVLTKALRKRKDRSKDLLIAIRYQRALVLMELGKKSRAMEDLQKVYIENPNYEKTAELLGLA